MYDPTIFYEDFTEKLRPGDILYIKNFGAYEDSYWIVLTSFCDLERRNRVVLGKIIPLESLANIDAECKGNLRKYRYSYYYFLPQLEGKFPESVVDYGMLVPLSRLTLEQARLSESDCRPVKSLSEVSRSLFQYHIANHFTRDETIEFFRPHIEGLVKILERLG